MEENDPDVYLNKAKVLVQMVYAQPLSEGSLSVNEINVVWFSKTLQNWKALLSTTRDDGLYFEVTYDGSKNQTYVDQYVKKNNTCVTDGEFDAFIAANN